MTGGLHLAPATSRGNAYRFFEQTVLDGVSRDFYDEYTERDLGDSARVWGLTSSTRTSWESVDIGDWVLFYTEENRYRYATRVTEKEHNAELGDAIRSELLGVPEDKSERDWDYLLFLEEPIGVSVSGDEVADLLDYGNRFPVRFLRVTDERMAALEQEYGDVESFVGAIRK